MIPKTYLFVLSLILSAVYVSASEADSVSRKVIHMIGTDFRPSYVFPTHEFFRGANSTGERIDATLSGHLKYGFRFSPSTKMGRMYPYAVQGIGIAYNTFFCPSEVGNPLAVYVFQTSRIAALTPKLSLDYEWNFGASFGWKKYDEETNPWNRVVGSKINAYINLGFMLNWQLAPNTNLRAGIDVTHYSNGNTHYPNSGVNTIGASVGVTHFFGNGVPERILSSGLQRENTFHRTTSASISGLAFRWICSTMRVPISGITWPTIIFRPTRMNCSFIVLLSGSSFRLAFPCVRKSSCPSFPSIWV